MQKSQLEQEFIKKAKNVELGDTNQFPENFVDRILNKGSILNSVLVSPVNN
jgi:hypothetical protein